MSSDLVVKRDWLCPEPGCVKSNRGFTQKRYLAVHKRTVHNKQEWKCNELNCGKVFFGKRNLFRHQHTVHRGLRDWNCLEPGCGLAFSTKFSMEKHQKTIHDRRDWKCRERGCSKNFESRSDLSVHKEDAHDKSSDLTGGDKRDCAVMPVERRIPARKREVSAIKSHVWNCQRSGCRAQFASVKELESHKNGACHKLLSPSLLQFLGPYSENRHSPRSLPSANESNDPEQPKAPPILAKQSAFEEETESDSD